MSKFDHILEKERPRLSDAERDVLWSEVRMGLIPHPTPSPYMTILRVTRPAAAVFLIMLLFVGGGTTALAERARPGDFLFPLDRMVENMELVIARSPEKRAQISAKHAEERIEELREIVQTKVAREHAPAETAQVPDAQVHAAVDALVRVMDNSQMNEVARERVYTNLFNEIEPLKVHVDIDTVPTTTSRHDKVQIIRNEHGRSRIDVREEAQRVRIEKKEGEVKIEYRSSIQTETRTEVRSESNKKNSRD